MSTPYQHKKVRREPGAPFTPREREIVELMASSMQLIKIASHLNLSAKTISTHLERLRHRFGVNSNMGLILRLIALGHICPNGDIATVKLEERSTVGQMTAAELRALIREELSVNRETEPVFTSSNHIFT